MPREKMRKEEDRLDLKCTPESWRSASLRALSYHNSIQRKSNEDE